MIEAGRVSVNGHAITEQGFKADPSRDRIVVDGHPLKVTVKPGVVLVFHKPRLVMTTRDDPGGRPTVMDYLPRKWQKLHPVGRLDFDTSGVLLLTDDGELTHLLTHPSHGAEKVYEARVRGVVEHVAIEKLERGVKLDDGMTAPCRAKVMAQGDKNALVQLVLREGRNRQVRRMLEAVGHPVGSLRRVSFAGIELEGLPAGEFRVLLSGEVKALRKRVEGKVKKLSAPKGKFSKPKPKRIIKPELLTPEVSGKKADKPKEAPHRPRNSSAAPKAPPLERIGSKARPTASSPKPGAAPRKPSGASRSNSSSRSNAASEEKQPFPRPQKPLSGARRAAQARENAQDAREASTSRPRSTAKPKNSEAAPKAPRSSDRNVDKAPVAKRIEKRWK